ncbi:MAG: hypothetical protein NZ749_11335 [bacterium]|nr:hypothetical protein [bacterium]
MDATERVPPVARILRVCLMGGTPVPHQNDLVDATERVHPNPAWRVTLRRDRRLPSPDRNIQFIIAHHQPLGQNAMRFRALVVYTL